MDIQRHTQGVVVLRGTTDDVELLDAALTIYFNHITDQLVREKEALQAAAPGSRSDLTGWYRQRLDRVNAALRDLAA